jgi:two-component system, NarL family, response regulator LiaR
LYSDFTKKLAGGRRNVSYPLDQISSRIRVLIVDDQIAMRVGLKFFFLAFDDLELVGEAANGEQALYLCGEVKPDVVLMDLAMPGMDGVSTTRAIQRYCPQAKVLALIGFGEEATFQKVLQGGAINYVCKNISADRLAEAIRAIHGGFQKRVNILQYGHGGNYIPQKDPYATCNAG